MSMSAEPPSNPKTQETAPVGAAAPTTVPATTPASPPAPADDALGTALSAFQQRLERAQRQKPPRRARFQTAADIDLKDLYTPLDAPGASAAGYLGSLGLPGAPPFTRGVQPTMYRGRLWTMRQYAGFGSAAESNQRYRFLLARGQTGLSVAFDLPTQMGRDPDHPLSRGEVGRVGVSIATLDDMNLLLDGLPLDQVTTSMTINATAATLLCMYIAVADARGVPRKALGGTIQNDILKEYIARGTYIYPPRPSLRLCTDTFAFCQREVPNWNTISISGYHIREAGSDAVQEVAFTLADGIAYVEAALAAGLHVDEFAPRLSFFFNAHNHLLEEVAKFRAARRLWAEIMRQRFAAKDDRSLMLRFHAQTAGSTLTAQQPLCNVVRTTVQALAAVLGGCQSLHTNGYDEALALPTEGSAQLALRTQQILANESGVADLVDALGGSYAIEALTDEIYRRARDYIARIDDRGGMVAAIEQRYPQAEIERRAYEHQRAVERKERVVVGVNDFVDKAAPTAGQLHRINPHLEADQVARVRQYRQERDRSEARRGDLHAALAALSTAARAPAPAPVPAPVPVPVPATGSNAASAGSADDHNLVERILTATKCGATVGEIADVLREAFGVYDNFPRS